VATIQKELQDDLKPTVLEHLKAIVTETTLQRNTGSGSFFENQVNTTSAEANAPTDVACTSLFGGTVHITQVQVSWTDNTVGQFKHRVYVRGIAGNWILWGAADAGVTEFVVKPLSPTPVYEFGVRAWDQDTGTESAIVTCVYFLSLRDTYVYQINETVMAA
jgi:hypothetical protein